MLKFTELYVYFLEFLGDKQLTDLLNDSELDHFELMILVFSSFSHYRYLYFRQLRSRSKQINRIVGRLKHIKRNTTYKCIKTTKHN